MELEQLMKMAEEAGFEHMGAVNMNALEFRPEVREMCAANKCRHYNSSWSCPPACGSLEEMQEKVGKYKTGLLIQTTAVLEDNFDAETMMSSAKEHGERCRALLKSIQSDGSRCFFMGAGGCNLCRTCTYPDAPCRFPDTMMSSMEACGLVVSDVCKLSGLSYYYGPLTLTYTACVLI